jgi:hypothetical protein
MLSAATAPRSAGASRAAVTVVRGLEILVFVGLPLLTAGLFGRWVFRAGGLFDFKTFWLAGHEVMHGHSPYTVLPAVADPRTFRPFVYPAPAAFFMAPFSMVPKVAAEALWTVIGIGAVFATLRLLNVRDWRCYGVVFMWPAVWSAVSNGSISTVLLCACAALWRYRSRPFVAGCLLSVLVVFKLYLWPLAVWLLATRRIRATAVSVAMTAVSALGGWALIGFAGLREYPHVLGRLTALVADESYSPYALARALGAGPQAARLLVIAAGGALLGAVVAYARRSDETAFVLAIAATFVLSPIIWPHYFVLLCVALAIASPEFDVGWLLPIGAWVATTAWSSRSPAMIGVALAVYGATAVWSIRRAARRARGPVPLLRSAVG